MDARSLFVAAAESKIGFPYRWGGKGPDLFDCSGFVCYCLNQAGLKVPVLNSASLAVKLSSKRIEKKDLRPGCILFYGRPRVHHVMACIRRWPDGHAILVGARSGDETTKDFEIAYSKSAMVTVVTADYWQKEFVFAADPF